MLHKTYKNMWHSCANIFLIAAFFFSRIYSNTFFGIQFFVHINTRDKWNFAFLFVQIKFEWSLQIFWVLFPMDDNSMNTHKIENDIVFKLHIFLNMTHSIHSFGRRNICWIEFLQQRKKTIAEHISYRRVSCYIQVHCVTLISISQQWLKLHFCCLFITCYFMNFCSFHKNP